MKLHLDSRIGGLGDVWMRLIALHALAALRPKVRVSICVAPVLLETAQLIFSDLLEVQEMPAPGALIYTHLGLLDTWLGLRRGQRFISPFFEVMYHDRQRRDLKQRLNYGLNHLVAATGRLHLPSPKKNDLYHGLMQVSFFRPYNEVPWVEFMAQTRRDLPQLRRRLQERYPAKPELPLLVFPSGSGHQFMPPEWAARHLPDAQFAFHEQDNLAAAYAQLDLQITTFADTPGLLTLAARAGRIFATDSFPSHLLQTYTNRAIILATQFAAARIVSPAFDGAVVDSQAPCCSCLTLGRSGLCEALRPTCMTWENPVYLDQMRIALQSADWQA